MKLICVVSFGLDAEVKEDGCLADGLEISVSDTSDHQLGVGKDSEKK